MMKVFPENMHDEGHSRKAYMMRVNDPHHVCFSGMTFIMYAFLE
jgi:hypothetical protein